jgi:hypothetical protein
VIDFAPPCPAYNGCIINLRTDKKAYNEYNTNVRNSKNVGKMTGATNT